MIDDLRFVKFRMEESMPATNATLPTTTRAVVNSREDPLAFEWRTVALEPPARDQAVVEVAAFSVNRGELALLAARPEGWRPGQEIAGRVIAAATDGSGPALGDRVAGLVEGGGWAQHVA